MTFKEKIFKILDIQCCFDKHSFTAKQIKVGDQIVIYFSECLKCNKTTDKIMLIIHDENNTSWIFLDNLFR